MKFKKVFFFSIVTSYHLTRKNLSKVSSKLISMSCNGSLLQRTVYKTLPDLCDTEKGSNIIKAKVKFSSEPEQRFLHYTCLSKYYKNRPFSLVNFLFPIQREYFLSMSDIFMLRHVVFLMNMTKVQTS